MSGINAPTSIVFDLSLFAQDEEGRYFDFENDVVPQLDPDAFKSWSTRRVKENVLRVPSKVMGRSFWRWWKTDGRFDVDEHRSVSRIEIAPSLVAGKDIGS